MGKGGGEGAQAFDPYRRFGSVRDDPFESRPAEGGYATGGVLGQVPSEQVRD